MLRNNPSILADHDAVGIGLDLDWAPDSAGCDRVLASMLAHRLDWPFEDADWFHPPANVEKMQSGVPLTDEDRWPWLRAIAAWIDETRAAGQHGVVACSALKRSYRDIRLR